MFERKFNLVRHKRLTQVDVASKIECKICEKVFLSEGELNVHMKDRHAMPCNIKTFKCDQCSAKFIRKFHLDRHMKGVHTSVPIVSKCSLARIV